VAHVCLRQGGADGHVGRQRLGDGWVDAPAEKVPLGNLVLRVVAQGVEDGAPALVAEPVAAEFHLCQGGHGWHQTRHNQAAHDADALVRQLQRCKQVLFDGDLVELLDRGVGEDGRRELRRAVARDVVATHIQRPKRVAQPQGLDEQRHVVAAPAEARKAHLLHSSQNRRRDRPLQVEQHLLVLAVGQRLGLRTRRKLLRDEGRQPAVLELPNDPWLVGMVEVSVPPGPGQPLRCASHALVLGQRLHRLAAAQVESVPRRLDVLRRRRLEKGLRKGRTGRDI